MLHVRTGEIVK